MIAMIKFLIFIDRNLIDDLILMQSTNALPQLSNRKFNNPFYNESEMKTKRQRDCGR